MNQTMRDSVVQAFGHGQTWTGVGLVIAAPLIYVLSRLLLGEVDNVLAGLIGAVSGLGCQMVGSGVMNRVRREQSPGGAPASNGNGGSIP